MEFQPVIVLLYEGTPKQASYLIGRLSGRKAFHVARRLSPFMGSVLPHIKTLLSIASNEEDQDDAGPTLERLAGVIPDIATILSEMSDQDCDYIIDNCLSVVSRQTDAGMWARVTTATGAPMFDLDMVEQLRLTGEVVRENLAGFFPTEAQRA